MNSPYIIGALSLIFITLNHYVLVSEKFKLHKMEGDKSYDPLFNRLFLHLSSLFILLLNLSFAYRIILTSLNLFPEPSLFSSIVNFLSFTRTIQSNLVGILLFIFGIFLRLYAVKALGRLFTFEVGLRKNHQLITKGPYKLIRHPGYLGYLLISLGIYTFFGTLFGISLSLIICFIIYLKRIPLEEKILSQEFGEDFERYKLKTKKLIPFIY